MIPIIPTITVTDNSSSKCRINIITMNKGDETNTYDSLYDLNPGDGNTINDIQIIGGEMYLRTERSGVGNGRIYTHTYTTTDCSGNTATISQL